MGSWAPPRTRRLGPGLVVVIASLSALACGGGHVRTPHACFRACTYVSMGAHFRGGMGCGALMSLVVWYGRLSMVVPSHMRVCCSKHFWCGESAKRLPTVSLASALSFFWWPVHRARVALDLVVPLFFPVSNFCQVVWLLFLLTNACPCGVECVSFPSHVFCLSRLGADFLGSDSVWHRTCVGIAACVV